MRYVNSPDCTLSPLFYGIRDVTPAPWRTDGRWRSFSPLFYGIRDVTTPGQRCVARATNFQSPILRDSWCYSSFFRRYSVNLLAFSPLFYGIRDVTTPSPPYQALVVLQLSVPYFTGFVMLLYFERCHIVFTLCLSVPYFTGFVMLRSLLVDSTKTCFNFQSPILRDSWCYASATGLRCMLFHFFQSPILRDSWCYRAGRRMVENCLSDFQSPILRDSWCYGVS